ncbi:hypothetical protein CHUAL_004239 [Chamberlinius hualienensis]
MSYSVIEQEDQYIQELTLDCFMQSLTLNSEASAIDTGSDSKKRKIVPVPDEVFRPFRESRQKENSWAKRSRDKRDIESANRARLAELQRINEERLLLLSGPAYYHYSLTPTYNCSREYFSKTNNDLFDNSLTGFVMRGNDVFQINVIKATGVNWNVTYCNTAPPRKTNIWHVLTVKRTMKGTIACIYSCSNDGISLAEFKCGATTNDPDVIKQELPYVEMAKYIQSENANYKIFDAHSNCPKDETCP